MSDVDGGAAAPAPTPADQPDPKGVAKRMTKAASQTVKQEGAHFADVAQDAAQRQVERRRGAISETFGDVAQAIRRAGEELDQREYTAPSRMAHDAAEGERLARTLGEKRPVELLRATRDFARENPLPFAAGAMLAGFAVARFFRSSAQPDPDAAPANRTGGPVPSDPRGSAIMTEPDPRSLAELVSTLVSEFADLVKKESALVRAEVSEKLTQTTRAGARLAGVAAAKDQAPRTQH